MYVTVFLILLFLLILYILFMPINLCINTNSNQYYIQLKGLAKASIEGHEKELLRIELKVYFLKFYFYPFKKNVTKKQKKEVEVSKKKKRRSFGVRKGMSVLKTFKVKRFLLDIDSGNCIFNAKLYPLFMFLNHNIGGFNINFQGRNQLVLDIQNRPIRIIKSFINF